MVNGELKPSKWSQRGDLVSAARQILFLPEGKKRRELIIDLANHQGCDTNTVYRRIFKATGERLKTKAGLPRSTRNEAGSHRLRPEYQQVMDYRQRHPNVMGADIKRNLEISVSASRINAWIRESKNVH